MNDLDNLPATVGGGAAPPANAGAHVENRRADYNRLVRTARLSSLILEKVDFKIHPEALGVNKALLTRSITPRTKVMSSGTADGTCVANVIWEVHFKFKKRTVVKCVGSYLISYEGIKDCSEEAVGLFVENVGKTATYAYFRALYAHCDWSANLGSPPLPVIQLQPKI
ncbi:hypothetical protein ACVWW6_000375 [Bradyrhizobium sp. USDA 3311]